MINKRKLNTAAPPPSPPSPTFFSHISRRLRSTLPRRRRQRFSPIQTSPSPFNYSEAPTSKKRIVDVALSDCSCVLTHSAATKNEGEIDDLKEFVKLNESTTDFAGSTVSNCMVESASDSVKRIENNDEFEVEEVESNVKSEVSSLSRFSTVNASVDLDENDVVSVDSVRRSFPETILTEFGLKSEVSSLSKFSTINASVDLAENDVVSVDSVRRSFPETILKDFGFKSEVCSGIQNLKKSENASVDSVQRSFPETILTEFELECDENFGNGSLESSLERSYSYSSAYSSIYLDSSEFDDLSEEFFDSGSQFSEKSSGDACPSRTSQLLKQFSQQFCRTSLLESSSSKFVANHCSLDEINLLVLGDEEDEESYRMLKSRERRQLYLRDYAAQYCSTDIGNLIIEQRLEMVHWIFEHSTNMELQNETMFLGINLLDRFLSKGYFKTKRSLQIAGISCLALATRIEENQPYNSVRQKTFYVGNTAYTRCEVVAMEWLVQEVLKFQCFLPTMYNFLWFYLKAARVNDAVEKTVRYLATLALLGHEQMCYWPSTVAASLVIIACRAAETDAHCHLLIESHGKEKDDTLPDCIKRLEFLVKYC